MQNQRSQANTVSRQIASFDHHHHHPTRWCANHTHTHTHTPTWDLDDVVEEEVAQLRACYRSIQFVEKKLKGII
jgi:hypothetical protein